MDGSAGVSVLNIHWGFTLGGISQYAVVMEAVGTVAPIEMSTICILSRKRHVDDRALRMLGNRVVLERKAPFDLGWIRRLRRAVDERAPDLIFTHGFNGHFVACVLKLLGARRTGFVASYHGPYHPPTRLKGLLAGLYNRFTEWYLRRYALAVITVAEHGKQHLVSKGVAADKITVIHNGIPDIAQDADVGALRRDIGVPVESVVVGVVSRLEPIKAIDVLLLSFRRLSEDFPSAFLAIIGAGVQEEYLKGLASQLQISERVRFAGYRPNAASYLAAIDIFALPSLSEFHSIGLLEAMRAGKAIVTTDVGGNTESIRNEVEGLIVQPGNVQDLESALRMLLSDRKLRMRLGSAARARFEKQFVVDVMIQQSADFLMRAAVVPGSKPSN